MNFHMAQTYWLRGCYDGGSVGIYIQGKYRVVLNIQNTPQLRLCYDDDDDDDACIIRVHHVVYDNDTILQKNIVWRAHS